MSLDKRRKYPVKKITNIGKYKEDTWYEVEWVGYEEKDWVYEGDCTGCPDKIKEFSDGFKGKPVDLKKTKPFSFEQKQWVKRRRRELGLRGCGLEVDPVPPPEVEISQDTTGRGSKRQRTRSLSPANQQEVAVDEPEIEEYLILLDNYNSDLNLIIDANDSNSGAPLTDAGFAYMFAGARANYGFVNGKVYYEVKVTENLAISNLEESMPNRHIIRVGWSVDSTTYQLGEDPFSYGYECTGKKSEDSVSKDYGVSFKLNDVVGVYLDASEEKESVELSFSVNGETQGVAFNLPRDELYDQVLFPHILTRNCRFEVNFGQKEEPWFPPMEGYEWANEIPVDKRIRGPYRPDTWADCQMIVMCGLPYAGKTTWANKFSEENPDQKFNILGTNAFLEKMKLNGRYPGSLPNLNKKCKHCLNTLLEIAAKQRRNYILDQTNVNPSTRKRIMSNFSELKRKAVVIVPTEEDAKVREKKKIHEEGKFEHDSAILLLKKYFIIPTIDDTFSEVEFPELALEEALKVIEKYKSELKDNGYRPLITKKTSQNQASDIEIDHQISNHINDRCTRLRKEERPSAKDLLNDTEFFAEEMGLKVEVVSRDEAVASTSESVQFRLRVLDPKKRRDKHKENEAIQFEFNVVTDDADKLAQDMHSDGTLMEEDVKVLAKLLRSQVQLLVKERDEREEIRRQNQPPPAPQRQQQPATVVVQQPPPQVVQPVIQQVVQQPIQQPIEQVIHSGTDQVDIEFLGVFLETESLEENSEDATGRGSKRPRSRSPSPANQKKVAEDEPEIDGSLVVLDTYNSDLNLIIDAKDFVSGAPLTDVGFAYMFAGARASYGFINGKVCYEVKVTENLAISNLEESMPNRHIIRVGWSVDSTTYQLGEDPFSYGYEGMAKISQNCEFKDYGVSFKLNDVVGVYLDASEEKESVELSFSVNGETQGIAFTLPREELNGRALFPHILTKNCRFEVNFGQKEEPWFPPTEGYKWANEIPLGNRLRGALAPPTMGDCQIIMMCGLPGAGKTTWANQFSAENPHLKINILGTSAILGKMTVNGLPRRNYYTRRLEILHKRCLTCVNSLLTIAGKRQRNYILDLTNVYTSTQQRNMSYFSGFIRKAVVIVPTEEDAKVREDEKIQEEGQEVADYTVMLMKANFKIPSVDDTFSEVEFPELALEEATKVIEKYKTEAFNDEYGQLERQCQTQRNGHENDLNDWHSSHSGRVSNRGPPSPTSHSYLPRQEHHIPISPSLNSEEKVIEEEILPDSGDPIDPLAEESIEDIRALKDCHQVEAVEDEIEFLEVFMDTEELEERSEEERQRNRSPEPVIENEEDEPEYDKTLVVLDWYNSDLNLIINKTDFVSGAPLTEAVFAYMYAGARATYGFENGKVCYEVKVTENLAVCHVEESEPNRHIVRVGWSVDSTTYQLGEDQFSYGYECTAKTYGKSEIKDYGLPFKLNDVVGVYLDASEEKQSVEISFSVNGVPQDVAFSLPREELNGRALFPHILTKNCRFEVNFGQKEDPWFPPTEGYEWASEIPLEKRLRGAIAPSTRAKCQIIAMCGLPYAGKTTYANKFSAENPNRKFNVLGTNAILGKMKVNGLPRRKTYTGKKYSDLFNKCIHCLNNLIKIAARRRRNYILDLTNIYLVALNKKMKSFSGFKRKAVVIVPTEEDAKYREKKKIQEEGKDESDSIVLQMKIDFKFPTVDKTFSEVEFPELEKEEALKVIKKYSTEAKAAQVILLTPKIEEDNLENGPNNNRHRESDSNSASNSMGHTPQLPRSDTDPPRPESSQQENGKRKKKKTGKKKPKGHCHNCNEAGHYINDCPEPRKKKEKYRTARSSQSL